MRSLIACYLYISLLLLPLPAFAGIEIAGVRIAENHTVDNHSLVLNGAGIRSKFFVKVYVGALYLRGATQNAEQAIRQGGPKSMQMIMLYKEVAARKITDGWNEGFEKNLSPDALNQLADRLEKFNALFPDLRQGDHVYMDYVPGTGTTLTINEESLGTIEGDDFFAALMKVWLGDAPADKQLKSALLGN